VKEEVNVRGTVLGTAATGKTTLPLRDLPMTVDTVSSTVIAEQGANDLVTALKNVPGVNAFTTYGVYEYYAFRGFLDSVQLVDGVRNEGNRINTQLTNIDRIEVLKGPSSALYGGGALGATVNLIRKKPSATPSYDFLASAGNWNTWRGAFGAGGRVGGTTMYRLDAGAERADGYRHNDATRVTITPSFAWSLGNASQLNLNYTFNRDRFAGDAGLPLVSGDLGVPVDSNVLNVPRDRNYRTPQDDATSRDHNLQLVYARQFTSEWGFRNTLSYRHFNDEYFLSEGLTFDPPSTILRDYLYFHHHRRPLTNLAEVTGRVTKGVEQNLVFGWEGQRYHNYTTLPEEDFFSATPIDAFNPVETQGPSDLTIASQNVFTNNTNAFYVQDNLTLAPRLKMLLGGRYDIYRRTSHSDAIANGEVETEGASIHREAEAFTSRVGIAFQPSSNLDVYGSFANAFKPLTLAQPDGSSLDPETGTQFEVGERLRLHRDRLQLRTSIYHIARQNVAFRRPGNIYVQAGEVRSQGFETELDAAVSAQLHVNASYGFTDAEFLDYEQSVGVNLRGNTPVFAPRHTFNVWAGYDWQNGLGVNAGVRYLGNTFADNENTFAIDGYGVLNLAVHYRRGLIEYGLNINNVTDTGYFVAHQDYLQVYPGNPVNAMATVRVRLK
jgi:iron complex outermembrane receptor protein